MIEDGEEALWVILAMVVGAAGAIYLAYQWEMFR